jgi:hypothetical protein
MIAPGAFDHAALAVHVSRPHSATPNPMRQASRALTETLPGCLFAASLIADGIDLQK